MNGYDVPVSYGQPDNWWLRSPWTDYDRGSCIIKPIGVIDDGSGGVTYSYGQAAYWWLRSPVTDDTFHSWLIIPDGDVVSYGRNVYSSYGKIRSPDTYNNGSYAGYVHSDGNVNDINDVYYDSYGKYLEILYSNLFRGYTPS